MGKFVIKKMKNGEFTFSLLATNGQEILAAGEGFKTLATCKNSIESVKNIAQSLPFMQFSGFLRLVGWQSEPTHPI